MADIGSLVIKLTASVDQLQTDMTKATRMVDDWKGKIESAMNGIKFSGLIGAVQEVYGIMDGLADKFKQMKREADSFGISIQQMQGLKNFAKGDWDQLSSGIHRLQAELGAAANGSSEAQGKFDKLGLSWETLKDMSPSMQLQEISSRFKELTNQADKADFLKTLFGREGQSLQPLLERGPQGIQQGDKQAQNLQQLNELLENHARGWDIVKSKMKDWANSAAGLINDVIGWYSDLLSKQDEVANNLANQRSMEGTRNAALSSADTMNSILNPSNQAAAPGPSEAFTKMLEQLDNHLAALTGGRNGQIDRMNITDKEKDTLKQRGGQVDFQEMLNKLTDQLGRLTGGKGSDIDKMNISEAQKDQLRAIRDEIDLRNRLKTVLDEAITPLEKLSAVMDDLNAALAQGLITPDQFNQAAAGQFDKIIGNGGNSSGIAPSAQAGTQQASVLQNQIEQAQADPQQQIVNKLEQIRQLLQDRGVVNF